MSFKFPLITFLLVAAIKLSATEVTIDVSKLEGKSSTFIGESGILQRIPDSEVVLLNVENLPALITVSSIQKGKISILSTIWLMSDSLSISGSVTNERFQLSPEKNGKILQEDLEDEWKSFLKNTPKASASRPLLVYVLSKLKFQKTEDLKTLAFSVEADDADFWAAEKIKIHLSELDDMGYNSEEELFQYLSAYDKKGNSVTFHRPDKKFLLIDFSSSGCRPCLQDIDKLVSLNADFVEDLEILSIWDDPKQAAWLSIGREQKEKITWTSLRDESHAVFTKFEVDVYPTYVLIDSQGKVVKRWKGSGIDKVRKYLLK